MTSVIYLHPQKRTRYKRCTFVKKGFCHMRDKTQVRERGENQRDTGERNRRWWGKDKRDIREKDWNRGKRENKTQVRPRGRKEKIPTGEREERRWERMRGGGKDTGRQAIRHNLMKTSWTQRRKAFDIICSKNREKQAEQIQDPDSAPTQVTGGPVLVRLWWTAVYWVASSCSKQTADLLNLTLLRSWPRHPSSSGNLASRLSPTAATGLGLDRFTLLHWRINLDYILLWSLIEKQKSRMLF